MQDIQLNDPLVKAMAAQLATQIPNAVTTINSRVTDGYTIVNPVNVYDHMPLLSTIAGGGFPAVAIEDMGSRIEDDQVSFLTGLHMFAIVPFVSNPDPEGLAWQLRRYQQAVMMAIQVDRTYGGKAWTTIIEGIEPGPMLGPADRPNALGDNSYVSWVAVEISCRREEV